MRVGEFFPDAPAAVPLVEPPAVSLALAPAQQAEALALIKDPGHLEGFRAVVAELRALQANPALSKLPASREECHVLSELVVTASKLAKQLDESRKKRVEPANAFVKRVNALFNGIKEEAEAARAKGDRWFLEYQKQEKARVEREEQERRRQAEEAARLEAVARAKADEALKAAEQAQTREELDKAEAVAAQALQEAEKQGQAVAAAVAVAPEKVMRGFKGDAGTLSIREVHKLDSFDGRTGIQELLDVLRDAPRLGTDTVSFAAKYHEWEQRREAVLKLADYLVPPLWWMKPPVLEALRKELAKAVKAGVHDIPGTVVTVDQGTTAR